VILRRKRSFFVIPFILCKFDVELNLRTLEMSPIIAGIATFFSVGAFIFYAVAASGYSQDSKVLKGSKWFYYGGTDPNYGDFKFYFGLKGFFFSVTDDDFSGSRFFDYDTFSDETNDDSLDNTMDKCDSSGKTAIGLTVVACIFSFFTIVANGAGGVTEEIRVKAVSAVLSIISCVFGMIAVGVFITSCYNKFNADVGDTNNLHYGTGSILAVTAFIFSWTAFILAFVNIVTDCSNVRGYNLKPRTGQALADRI
jgi:hypothetical protein